MFLKGNNVIKISLLTVVLAIIILINYGRIYSIMSNLSIKFPAINRVSYIFNDVGYALIGDGSSRSVAWSNGLKIIQIAGTSNNDETRQKRRERIMSSAKDLIIGNDEKNRIENPSITESALIVIPLPAVFRAVTAASL